MSARSPCLFRCEPCGHVWPALWTPLEATRAARLMKAGCPACGERRRLYLASAAAAEAWRSGPRGEPCFFKDREPS